MSENVSVKNAEKISENVSEESVQKMPEKDSQKNSEKTLILGKRDEMVNSPESERTFIKKHFPEDVLNSIKSGLLRKCAQSDWPKIAVLRLDARNLKTKIFKNLKTRHFVMRNPHEAMSVSLSNQLRCLELSSISLKNFTADLPNLESLDLSNNKIMTLENVKCPRLIYLNLRYEKLQ